MNTLLIIRPEILSLFIIIFLIIYDRYCVRYREGRDYFIGLALMCLGHDIMALVTEITVNMTSVPRAVNDVVHVLFFLFSLLYTLKYFEYALSLIILGEKRIKYIIAGYVFCVAAIIIMLLSPIEYIQGDGTNYSMGLGVLTCYGLGFLLILIANVIMICNHKRINGIIVYTLIPLSFIMLGFLVVQILVPEFLFTGSALTMNAVGVFLAIENPVGKFREKAFIDHTSLTWNRNGYDYDVEHIVEQKIKKGVQISCVIADINGLKKINDSCGHHAGDRLIAAVGRILRKQMLHAFRIYRLGGDEFAVLYFNTNEDVVKKELNHAKRLCDELELEDGVPHGASFGWANRMNGETFRDMIQRADASMYSEKRRFYEEQGHSEG